MPSSFKSRIAIQGSGSSTGPVSCPKRLSSPGPSWTGLSRNLGSSTPIKDEHQSTSLPENSTGGIEFFDVDFYISTISESCLFAQPRMPYGFVLRRRLSCYVFHRMLLLCSPCRSLCFTSHYTPYKESFSQKRAFDRCTFSVCLRPASYRLGHKI
jgi:hypothetical protein